MSGLLTVLLSLTPLLIQPTASLPTLPHSLTSRQSSNLSIFFNITATSDNNTTTTNDIPTFSTLTIATFLRPGCAGPATVWDDRTFSPLSSLSTNSNYTTSTNTTAVGVPYDYPAPAAVASFYLTRDLLPSERLDFLQSVDWDASGGEDPIQEMQDVEDMCVQLVATAVVGTGQGCHGLGGLVSCFNLWISNGTTTSYNYGK